MEQMDFSIEVSESEIEKFADYLYQKENAKATINKYMADIKKFLFFWQMISESIKKYCCNIKNGLFKNMLSIVLIRCLPH